MCSSDLHTLSCQPNTICRFKQGGRGKHPEVTLHQETETKIWGPVTDLGCLKLLYRLLLHLDPKFPPLDNGIIQFMEHHVKCFSPRTSFYSVKQVLSSPRYTYGKKSQGKVNMLKVTQVLSGSARL